MTLVMADPLRGSIELPMIDRLKKRITRGARRLASRVIYGVTRGVRWPEGSVLIRSRSLIADDARGELLLSHVVEAVGPDPILFLVLHRGPFKCLGYDASGWLSRDYPSRMGKGGLNSSFEPPGSADRNEACLTVLMELPSCPKEPLLVPLHLPGYNTWTTVNPVENSRLGPPFEVDTSDPRVGGLVVNECLVGGWVTSQGSLSVIAAGPVAEVVVSADDWEGLSPHCRHNLSQALSEELDRASYVFGEGVLMSLLLTMPGASHAHDPTRSVLSRPIPVSILREPERAYQETEWFIGFVSRAVWGTALRLEGERAAFWELVLGALTTQRILRRTRREAQADVVLQRMLGSDLVDGTSGQASISETVVRLTPRLGPEFEEQCRTLLKSNVGAVVPADHVVKQLGLDG